MIWNRCTLFSRRKLVSIVALHTSTEISDLLPQFPLLQLYDVNSELEGRYALHYAADYGQHKVLEYLINKGANPNVSCFNAVEM